MSAAMYRERKRRGWADAVLDKARMGDKEKNNNNNGGQGRGSDRSGRVEACIFDLGYEKQEENPRCRERVQKMEMGVMMVMMMEDGGGGRVGFGREDYFGKG